MKIEQEFLNSLYYHRKPIFCSLNIYYVGKVVEFVHFQPWTVRNWSTIHVFFLQIMINFINKIV